MGLAAGQARLLTITGRKSDCEFQSMRLSHQKIALARDLAALSNEYQNSLNQTKLIYDYYGTCDESNPLSYGLMMTPSALNDYMPILLTDSMGRVVLDSKLAAAARAAGIPQEGLGTLPSDIMRNDFISALADNEIISTNLRDKILQIPYNQAAGMGGGTTIVAQTQDITYEEFLNRLATYSVSPLQTHASGELVESVLLFDNIENKYYVNNISGEDLEGFDDIGHDLNGVDHICGGDSKDYTLEDILRGNVTLVAVQQGNRASSIGFSGGAIDAIVNSSFWDDMLAAVEELLDVGDAASQRALDYARSQVEFMISNQCDPNGKGACGEDEASNTEKWQFFNSLDMSNVTFRNTHTKKKFQADMLRFVLKNDKDYIGMVVEGNADTGHDNKNNCHSLVSVNLSTMAQAYLTYFLDYINGIAKTDAYGREVYDVEDTIGASRLVNANSIFRVKTGESISSDSLAQATFYDALFNQICRTGWVENEHVNDKEYLHQMLKNGMMFITNVKDDGYYYQGNYATHTYIKEVADDTKIAQAEAKYNTEKAKLNAKEETLDLKMKNLDTEISSLTTEYDTVKNTIAKQIEKTFKRYA